MESLQDKFIEWVCNNYPPIWDDRLVELMEDGDVQTSFLQEMGLPEDTEITR